MPICKSINCSINATTAVYNRSGGFCTKCEAKNKARTNLAKKRSTVVMHILEANAKKQVDESKKPEELQDIDEIVEELKGMATCPKCAGNCLRSTLKERGGCAACFPISKSKKKIPQAIRQETWFQWVGKDKSVGKCYCCESNEITFFNFCAGHVIAESKGGKTAVENLRPVCGACNSSMGTNDMDEFKKSLKADKASEPTSMNELPTIVPYGNVGIDPRFGNMMYAHVQEPDGSFVLKYFVCVRNAAGHHAFLENQMPVQ